MNNQIDFQIRTISDVVVHYLFARQQTEPSLVSFINAVFSDAGEPPIKSAKVGNPFSPATFLTEKNTVVDIIALDEQSRQIHIEVQVLEEKSFIERCAYYLCKNYSSQLLQGEGYDKLQPVISIILTDFNLFPEIDRTRTSFFFMAKEIPGFVLTEHLQFHFLQLPKELTERGLNEINETLLNWIKFFSCPNKITLDELKRLSGKDEGLTMAITEYEHFQANAELRDLARRREIFLRDVRSSNASARKEGEEIGEKRGIAIGEARGITIGEARGITIGEARGKLQSAIQSVLDMIEDKFLFLSETLRTKVEGITDTEKLRRLCRYGYREASSLDEMEAAVDKVLNQK